MLVQVNSKDTVFSQHTTHAATLKAAGGGQGGMMSEGYGSTGQYAEIYIGSGRFTGYRTDEPTRDNTGAITPNFVYVGDMSADEFNEEFERQQPLAYSE